MRTVVTGGRGFIGSHLVDALVERGDEVTVFDNGQTGDNENPDAQYQRIDLTREWLPLIGVDLVFHTAAIGRTPWAIADPVLCWQANTFASIRLLDAARTCDVKRVVLSSSNIVYAAETPYKASKLAMEDAAKVYRELYGLDTICLRYANTYGTRQREDGIGPNTFAALRKSLRENGYVTITGDGSQSRDWIHVSDVVRANLLAGLSSSGGVLDICTGTNTNLNQIVELLRVPKVTYVGKREGDVEHIFQDPVPAFSELGFCSEVKLEDGIWDCFDEGLVSRPV